MKTHENKTLINDSELAQLLGVSRSTLYHWRKKKWIPFYQIGRNIKYNVDEVLLVAKVLD